MRIANRAESAYHACCFCTYCKEQVGPNLADRGMQTGTPEKRLQRFWTIQVLLIKRLVKHTQSTLPGVPSISPDRTDGGLFCMSFVSICFESSKVVQSEDWCPDQEHYGLISLTHQCNAIKLCVDLTGAASPCNVPKLLLVCKGTLE